MPSPSEFLINFVTDLKSRGASPKNIEVSRVGRVFLTSIFDELNSDVMVESIYTGMDVDSDISVLKGLVEMIERKAYRQGAENGLTSCNTERSDGFAAFPFGVAADTAGAARANALHEAIERFAWASWWDDQDISHEVREIHQSNADNGSEILLRELRNILPLEKVFRVSPKIEDGSHLEVAIYFAFLEPYGVISGGACGPSEEVESVNFRALCELSRHALGVRKIKAGEAVASTFYEKRLAYFGLTELASENVKKRLFNIGNKHLRLPNLEIDEVIPHKLSDLVTVHRCLFKDQPPFVGGELERLCL